MNVTDINLRCIMRYNLTTKKYTPNPGLKYFRLPNSDEYPLNLRKNYESFIPRHGQFCGPFDHLQYYVMDVAKSTEVMKNVNFYLNRRIMVLFMEAKPICHYTRRFEFEAFRFKGTIYVKKIEDNSEFATEELAFRNSFAFLTRQYLFSDGPGMLPNTDDAVDAGDQIYGMFTAQLGQFRLLYSSELVGVTNDKKIEDVSDSKQLRNCDLALMTMIHSSHKWRYNFRIETWLHKAYLCGAKHLIVARFENIGEISQPVEVVSVAELIAKSRHVLVSAAELLHSILTEISEKLAGVEDPALRLKFSLIGQSLVFEPDLSAELTQFFKD